MLQHMLENTKMEKERKEKRGEESKKESIFTCTVFASLGKPETMSWRIIFEHRNHLSQIKYISS